MKAPVWEALGFLITRYFMREPTSPYVFWHSKHLLPTQSYAHKPRRLGGDRKIQSSAADSIHKSLLRLHELVLLIINAGTFAMPLQPFSVTVRNLWEKTADMSGGGGGQILTQASACDCCRTGSSAPEGAGWDLRWEALEGHARRAAMTTLASATALPCLSANCRIASGSSCRTSASAPFPAASRIDPISCRSCSVRRPTYMRKTE